MDKETLLPGVTLMRTSDALIIHSTSPLRVLSSAVMGGGLKKVHYIINRHVHKHYDHPHPDEDMKRFAGEMGITQSCVGLMTAVRLHRARVLTMQMDDVTVVVLGTVGLGNPVATGITPPVKQRPGTINLIALTNAHLSPAAMVNAVITITEAKTAVLHQFGIRTPTGEPATGTSTDAVVVACMETTGNTFAYAGPITTPGWLMARAVRTLLQRHLEQFPPEDAS